MPDNAIVQTYLNSLTDEQREEIDQNRRILAEIAAMQFEDDILPFEPFGPTRPRSDEGHTSVAR